MLFDSEMKEMLCMKKNCYGGILYEVYGTVVDLKKSGLNVEFGLEPFLAPEAAMTDGNDTVPATVLIRHKLVRKVHGMSHDADIFFANRKWRYTYDTELPIRNGDRVRIFIDTLEIDKVRSKQMDGSCTLPLANVLHIGGTSDVAN